MNPIALTVLIVLLLILIGVGPLLTILSLNTLFALAIPFSLGTWAAVFWLQIIVAGAFGARFKKD